MGSLSVKTVNYLGVVGSLISYCMVRNEGILLQLLVPYKRDNE